VKVIGMYENINEVMKNRMGEMFGRGLKMDKVNIIFILIF
jgi:hypothetical protein